NAFHFPARPVGRTLGRQRPGGQALFGQPLAGAARVTGISASGCFPSTDGSEDGQGGGMSEANGYEGLTRATLQLSLVYWTCMFVADSVLGYFIDIDPLQSAPLKFILFGAGALMTFGMSLLLFRLRGLGFPRKAVLSFLMTAALAPLFVAVDFL